MEINNPTTEQIPMLKALWKEAFEDTDEFLDLFFATAFSVKRAVCITSNQAVVSALYFFDCLLQGEKIAYIYAVATKKDFRGQGLCKKLMDAAHEMLRSMGYKGAVLVPGSQSLFTMYQNMGYKVCAYMEEMEVLPQKKDIEIKEISKAEFARMRRKHLSLNSVIQEGENLDFLETFAKFYKGKDFIMASYTTDNTLIAAEFLGNTDSAPFVINALGFSKGVFRTPGNSNPFAMYYDLSEGALPSPNYFGLAFD